MQYLQRSERESQKDVKDLRKNRIKKNEESYNDSVS
jgi:hypothetical protein